MENYMNILETPSYNNLVYCIVYFFSIVYCRSIVYDLSEIY